MAGLAVVCLATARPPLAAAQGLDTRNVLRDVSSALETLSAKVAPSVVQVEAVGFAVESNDRGGADLVIKPQRTLGSGVILGEDGYIVTNAHVVSGGEHVSVVLSRARGDAAGSTASPLPQQPLPAQLVGTAPDLDLALLKIDATGLKALPVAADGHVRQGELVFAFGNPEGLRDSVTMGIVSSVARQPDPDSPSVYIQTDAPINPGNSGGPLVNVDGELVGLDTFILSDSGGSEGLGFAIPGAVVSAAYSQLRINGQMKRGFVGMHVQGITPALAAGLNLTRSTGVVVADVSPGSPADLAGVQIGDIVMGIDGQATDNVPQLVLRTDAAAPGDTMTIDLLRESARLSLTAHVAERPEQPNLLVDLSDIDRHSIKRLGIIAADVTGTIASTLRVPFGVLVAARDQRVPEPIGPLMSGDVIHAVNGLRIRSIDGLRALLDGTAEGAEVVLQIERSGQLKFVTQRIY